MARFYSLARKDVSSYFYSWLGILIFVLFFFMAGILFSLLVSSYGKMSFEALQNNMAEVESARMTHFVFGSFFVNLAVAMIFLIPLISMRSFAEEKNQQTLEMLFTYPLSDFDIVFGKFLGLLWFICLLLFPTLGYVYIFQQLGGVIDWGPVLCSYLGLFLLVVAFLSLGLFVSSLTDYPVISALVTFSSLILLWGLEWIAGVTDGNWSQVFKMMSPLSHYREFTFGILDLTHISYFCFFSLYFLFLTLRSVETRNWKG